MGVHAGRENQNWDTRRVTYGCIRIKPETFNDIKTGIKNKGGLTRIIVQNNRQSDNSETVNKVAPVHSTKHIKSNDPSLYKVLFGGN